MQKLFENQNLVVTLSVEDIKNMAYQIKKDLKAYNVPLSACYETLSQSFQENSWNHFSAKFEKAKHESLRAEKIELFMQEFFECEPEGCAILEDEEDSDCPWVYCLFDEYSEHYSEDQLDQLLANAWITLTEKIFQTKGNLLPKINSLDGLQNWLLENMADKLDESTIQKLINQALNTKTNKCLSNLL